MVDLKGKRLPHRLTKLLVRGLRRIVVKLQRTLHRVDKPANVLPSAARGIVSGHLNLLRLLLGQNGVSPKAGDERLRTALHQIDLCAKTCILRHLFSRPPHLNFLTAVLLGDGLHNTSREPMCQLCPFRTCKLLRPNFQGDKKGGHLATHTPNNPASRCLKLNPHVIPPQHVPAHSAARGRPWRPSRIRPGRPRWSRRGSADRWSSRSSRPMPAEQPRPPSAPRSTFSPSRRAAPAASPPPGCPRATSDANCSPAGT